MSQAETIGRNEVPFVPFPENPEVILIEGIPVYKYISPQEMAGYIHGLSDKIKLRDFERIIVNNNGGWFLFNALASLQNYVGEPFEVEYHRSPNGYEAIVVTPIPPELKRAKNLIIDDIYDTAGTLKQIFEDTPFSSAVVAVKKRNIPNQISLDRVFVGVEVDNYWLGGSGMDFGPGYKDDFPRDYPGIVVKP